MLRIFFSTNNDKWRQGDGELILGVVVVQFKMSHKLLFFLMITGPSAQLNIFTWREQKMYYLLNAAISQLLFQLAADANVLLWTFLYWSLFSVAHTACLITNKLLAHSRCSCLAESLHISSIIVFFCVCRFVSQHQPVNIDCTHSLNCCGICIISYFQWQKSRDSPQSLCLWRIVYVYLNVNKKKNSYCCSLFECCSIRFHGVNSMAYIIRRSMERLYEPYERLCAPMCT